MNYCYQQILPYYQKIAAKEQQTKTQLETEAYESGTILYYAAMLRQPLDTLRLLILNHPEQINQRSCGNHTPLMAAAYYGYPEIVDCLLENNAHINEKDRSGKNSLTYAALNGHTDVIRVFINHKADVNRYCRDVGTPLLCAAKEGHLDAVKCLIEEGDADITRPHMGMTAYSLAQQNGHQAVVEYLMEKEAALHIKSMRISLALYQYPFKTQYHILSIHPIETFGWLLYKMKNEYLNTVTTRSIEFLWCNPARDRFDFAETDYLSKKIIAIYKNIDKISVFANHGSERRHTEQNPENKDDLVEYEYQQIQEQLAHLDFQGVRKAARLIAQGARDQTHLFFQMPKEINRMIAASVADTIPFEEAVSIARKHLGRP